MEGRRLEDRAPGVLVASVASALSGDSLAGAPMAGSGTGAGGWGRESRPLLLVEAEDGQLLCVAGGETWRLTRPEGVPLEQVADVMAENVRYHHAATLQKQRFNEGFLVFVERLNRARSRRDVYEALLEQAPQLMGAYAAVLFVTTGSSETRLELQPITDARVPIRFGRLRAVEILPRPVPALITYADVSPGQPFAGFAPLFHELHARQLTCITLGDQGLLVLIERRLGRDFSGEEWFRLQTIGHHAQRSLERLDLLASERRTASAALAN